MRDIPLQRAQVSKKSWSPKDEVGKQARIVEAYPLNSKYKDGRNWNWKVEMERLQVIPLET